MTDLIYEPKGRAREYGAWALNVYNGCDHGCLYCYAPTAMRRPRAQFVASTVRADRHAFIERLDREAQAKQAQGLRGQVLLSFACDPYQHLDKTEGMTAGAIQILHGYGFFVNVLTKGGVRGLRDLDLFTPRCDAFGATLTFLDDMRSLEWEPKAALPVSRLAGLKAFHGAHIPTWVSLEPVIDPESALAIIRETRAFVDTFKVGKLNYHAHAKTVDWSGFARAASALLERLGYVRVDRDAAIELGQRRYYLKEDLARYL